jgi:hypothetical protein
VIPAEAARQQAVSDSICTDRRRLVYGRSHRDDPDAVEALQVEHVRVPRDDQVGLRDGRRS